VTTSAATERERRIIDVLMSLEAGEVTTYGDVAEVAGYPRRSRLVGSILAGTEADVPWWRVVAAGGHLRANDDGRQRQLLQAEGVVVRGERVVDAPIGRFARPELR
jgi:methylated-DNA-protein-cysteine methyltransferase-like protein